MFDARARRAAFESALSDESRFREWYDHALPVVFGFVHARCGGDRTLAQDITQDAFVEAVRCRDRFDGRSEPVTWICGIARHRLADHYRHEQRDRRRTLQLAGQAQQAPDPAESAGTSDSVRRALHHLPTGQQQVLVLHYLDGAPVREIAQLLGRTEGSVESLLSRGRAAFRRELGAEAGEPDA